MPQHARTFRALHARFRRAPVRSPSRRSGELAPRAARRRSRAAVTSGSSKASEIATERAESACFMALVNASCTIRKTVSSAAAERAKGVPDWVEAHGQPGRAHPFRHPLQLGQARLGGEGDGVARDRADGGGFHLAVTQESQQPPHVTQGLAPGAGDVVHGFGGPLRVRPACDGSRVGQSHHDLNVVRDDVMHLPGDAGPLCGRGQDGLLITLELEARPRVPPTSRSGCAARARRRRRRGPLPPSPSGRSATWSSCRRASNVLWPGSRRSRE